MWSDASTTAMWNALAGSLGTQLSTIIAAILIGVAGFMVLGFAIRKVKKYITGRKF